MGSQYDLEVLIYVLNNLIISLADERIPTFDGGKKVAEGSGRSKGLVAAKISAMTKGSDKLAKAAEEQASKVIE